MWDYLSQIVIVVLGPLSVFLTARKNGWGFVVGLASQQFWFITTYQHQQWGVMGITVLYCFIWVYGIWNWFVGNAQASAKKTLTIGPSTTEHSKEFDLLVQAFQDSKSVPIVIRGTFTVNTIDTIVELLKAVDQIYKSLGGQELRFQIPDLRITAKPYDDPDD